MYIQRNLGYLMWSFNGSTTVTSLLNFYQNFKMHFFFFLQNPIVPKCSILFFLLRITKIIMPCLNSSSFEIRTEALKLVGSAVQNNVPVQIKCLEQNILQPILHLFNQHVISKEHVKAGKKLLQCCIGRSRTSTWYWYKLEESNI